MKNFNENQNIENNQNHGSDFQPSFQVSVYNEMSDQTSQQIDVIQMIQNQFQELNRLSQKRIFLLKEISHYLK